MVVAKVYSMQEIELRPEMDPADFERVFAAEVAPAPVLPGLKARLLKGNRGARDGKYLVLLEVEDEETRDRYFPGPGERSEEFRRFMDQHPDTAAAWAKVYASRLEPVITDYVVVVE
jgi:hypothetical protein